MNSVSDDNHAEIKGHAAWYREDDHGIVVAMTFPHFVRQRSDMRYWDPHEITRSSNKRMPRKNFKVFSSARHGHHDFARPLFSSPQTWHQSFQGAAHCKCSLSFLSNGFLGRVRLSRLHAFVMSSSIWGGSVSPIHTCVAICSNTSLTYSMPKWSVSASTNMQKRSPASLGILVLPCCISNIKSCHTCV